MFTKTFLFLALLSVVSSQTFNRRSRFRSGNFRRFQDDGALDENGASANGGASNSFSSQLTDETPAPQYGGSEQATLDGGAVDEAGVTDEGTGDGGEAPLEPTGDAALEGAGPDAGAGEGGADLTPTDRDSDEPTGNLADDGGAGGVAAPPPPPTPSNGRGTDEEEHDPNDLSWLRNAIRGEPDQDYPILADIPKTAFRCSDQQYAGYYGDPEARCQVFHICQKPDNRMDSFLCPNGTIFSQRHFVCVWWWQYDCANTEKDYALNANLYAEGGADYQNNQLQDVGAGGDTTSTGDGYGSTAPGDEVTETPALGGTLDGEAGFTDTAGGEDNGLTTFDGGAGDIPATGTDEETANGVETTGGTADENGALQGGTADGYSKTTQSNGANLEARAIRRGAIRRGSRVSSLRLRSRSRSSSRRRSLRRRGSSRSRSRSSSRRSSRSRLSRRRSLRRVSSSRRRRNSRRGAARRSRVSRRHSRRTSRFRN